MDPVARCSAGQVIFFLFTSCLNANIFSIFGRSKPPLVAAKASCSTDQLNRHLMHNTLTGTYFHRY